MVEALKEEVEKQFNYFIENAAFRPDQTTVLWDADLKQTKVMRKKEFESARVSLRQADTRPVNLTASRAALKMVDEVERNPQWIIEAPPASIKSNF